MIKNYLQLMRLDKPIGIFLVLWPAIWALWLSSHGQPNLEVLLIFIVGGGVMRTAGCVINDIADRKFDKYVERTQHRPLTAGRVSLLGAYICFGVLCLIGFMLVLLLNTLTIFLAICALFFVCLYPFTKRLIHLPQVILGIAFSFSIPMAFAAQTNTLPALAWYLFVINIIWVVAYDTMYALMDREDDVKIGIKSSAILFGQYDKLMIGLLQFLFIVGLSCVGWLQQLHWPYAIAMVLVGVICIYQQYLIKTRHKANCLRAFLSNNYIGLVIFLSLLVS